MLRLVVVQLVAALAAGGCVRASFDGPRSSRGTIIDGTDMLGDATTVESVRDRWTPPEDPASEWAIRPDAATSDALTTTMGRWVRHLSSPTSISKVRVAVEPLSGNVAIAAEFGNSIDLGDGQPLTSAGDPDILLASYDRAGNLRWKKRFGDSARQYVEGLSVDARGNIVLAAELGGTVDFGGGPVAGGGGGGILIASFDQDGAHRWSKAFGVDTVTEQVTALTTDGAGNCYLAGGPNRGQDFGGGALSRDNDEDAYLASFDGDGVHRWSKGIGGAGTHPQESERIDGLAFSAAQGALFLVGSFNDTVDLGGGPLVSAGGNDVLLARFDDDGSHRWSERFGSIAIDEPQDIAVDDAGNVYVVGRYLSPIDFGGGLLEELGFDTFLASFDAAGRHRWSRRLVTADTSPFLAVTTDASGDVYVLGDFSTTATLGGATLDLGAGSHIFFASYNPWGAHRFSQAFGSVTTVSQFALASAGPSSVVLAGSFSNTLDVYGQTLVSAGASDVFLMAVEVGSTP